MSVRQRGEAQAVLRAMIDGMTHLRRCIQIQATDSPNVRYALAEIRAGRAPTGRVLVPGVLSYAEYVHRRKTWDEQKQTEGLDARWYEGPALKLTPKTWLDAAVAFAERLVAERRERKWPRYMGVDSGEGGDDTAWVIGDRLGVLHIRALKTPDTNMIYGGTLELMREWNVAPERTVFDLGGGGREHAQRLRAAGYPVRAVGFGRAPQVDPKRAKTMFEEKRDTKEDAYAYINRRSEMFWDIRGILERDAEENYVGTRLLPELKADGFALPMPLCTELIRQLAPIPLTYDAEGRFKLLPKQDPNDPKNPNTLKYLIGCSPDIADALALMVFGMTHKPTRGYAGAG